MDRKTLENKFDNDMHNIPIETLKFGYNPTYFLKMLSEKGGYLTAKELIKSDNLQSGFTKLWEEGRLDLSVEAHVIKLEYSELFTDAERQTCIKRLEDYGYKSNEG